MATRSAFVAATVGAGVIAAVAVAAVVTAFDVQAMPRPASVPAALPVNAQALRAGADALALEQGRVTYVQLCMPCHGAQGDGRGEWAYRVTPRPSNLTHERTQRRSDDELFQIVSEPRAGTPMIGWKHQLSEPQRRQLVGYLRQLGSNAGVAR